LKLPAREVTEHAQPVSSADLAIGGVYFMLQFVDEEFYVPMLEPIVFIGPDLEPYDKGVYYFQDAESHRAGIRYDCPQKLNPREEMSGRFYLQRPTELKHIFEFERALDQLLVCEAQRQKARQKR
jgi:hypothetical protein